MTGEGGNPWLFVVNVVGLILLGVLGSFWLLRYTDWFPVVGGLLGLTGAFAWVAFLSNLIRKERKDAAQVWLDRNVFERPRTVPLLLVLIGAFVLGFTSWHGTLVIDSFGDSLPRAGTIAAPAAPGSTSGALVRRIDSSARGEAAILLPTGFWQGRVYAVKLQGLPALEKTVRAWARTRVRAPQDFLSAPVLLLRPTAIMSGEASHGEFVVEVEVDGAPYGRLDDYHGEAVWIGADSDVTIPQSLIDRWRLEVVASGGKPEYVQRWLAPLSVLGARRLVEGSSVTATILLEHDGGHTIQGRAETQVRIPESAARFPQELVIDVLG